MFDNDLLVKKYPFLGNSTKIIEYFSIIGYNEKYIPNMINSFENEKKQILLPYYLLYHQMLILVL